VIPDGRSEDNFEDEELNVSEESEMVQTREFYGGNQTETTARSGEHLWLVSYSDFMTIMMIFFLAMYGYTHLAKKELEKRVDRFSAIASEMKAKMRGDVRITSQTDKITVELGEGVLFKSGSPDLSPGAKRTLALISESIRSTDGDVIVEGHTDNVPIRGRFASNWELSASRAFSVIQELAASGVPASRLTAWGFGENRPVVANDSAENRQRNRRIDIVILKKKVNRTH
jgi:chemotaxis protein MotB